MCVLFRKPFHSPVATLNARLLTYSTTRKSPLSTETGEPRRYSAHRPHHTCRRFILAISFENTPALPARPSLSNNSPQEEQIVAAVHEHEVILPPTGLCERRSSFSSPLLHLLAEVLKCSLVARGLPTVELPSTTGTTTVTAVATSPLPRGVVPVTGQQAPPPCAAATIPDPIERRRRRTGPRNGLR